MCTLYLYAYILREILSITLFSFYITFALPFLVRVGSPVCAKCGWNEVIKINRKTL